ncbi:hypothetical protein ACFFX0_23340 [Citricoccus parietis]|uniref:Uncharacterized protein n=1 Tax=Citricoccus parietis TaxID=592307 RepID=A0ABV5G4U6_9MICC
MVHLFAAVFQLDGDEVAVAVPKVDRRGVRDGPQCRFLHRGFLSQCQKPAGTRLVRTARMPGS